MNSSNRDDFSAAIKRSLAERAGFLCTNPDCCASTSGPQATDSKSVNIGVAAHITAAAKGGPRYDSTLDASERSGITNGVWLCQNCAKLIDNDPLKYFAKLLHEWKMMAEKEASMRLGKTASMVEKENEIIDKCVSTSYVKKAGIVKDLRKKDMNLDGPKQIRKASESTSKDGSQYF